MGKLDLVVPPELEEFRFGRKLLVSFAEIVTELASRGEVSEVLATRLYLWFRVGRMGLRNRTFAQSGRRRRS